MPCTRTVDLFLGSLAASALAACGHAPVSPHPSRAASWSPAFASDVAPHEALAVPSPPAAAAAVEASFTAGGGSPGEVGVMPVGVAHEEGALLLEAPWSRRPLPYGSPSWLTLDEGER